MTEEKEQGTTLEQTDQRQEQRAETAAEVPNKAPEAADAAVADTSPREEVTESPASAAEKPPVGEDVCLPENDVNKLVDLLAQKNAIIEAYTARLMRLQADFENYRRRTQKEKDDLAAVVTEKVLRDFLPVLDNLQRALQAQEKATAADSLSAGVTMIYRQLMSILEKHGVSVIKAVGEMFDPNLHEAVMRVTDASKPDGLIVEELQTGYLYRGTALRPSMVKVVANI